MPQLLLYFRRPLLLPAPPPPPPPSVSDSVDSTVLLLLLLFFAPREFKSHHAIFVLISHPGFDASEFSLDAAAAAAATGDGDRGAAAVAVAAAADGSDNCAIAAAAALLVFRRRLLFVAAVSRYALIFFVGVMTRRKPDFRRRCRAAAFVDIFCNDVAAFVCRPPSSLTFEIRTSSMLFKFKRLLYAEWCGSVVDVDVDDV